MSNNNILQSPSLNKTGQRGIKKVSFLIVLFSGLRRRFYVLCRPRYVIVSLLKRKDNCKECGLCCLLNKPWCRYLEDDKCAIYDKQPFFCKIFPIDHRDKQLSRVSKDCGYWWYKNEKRK